MRNRLGVEWSVGGDEEGRRIQALAAGAKGEERRHSEGREGRRRPFAEGTEYPPETAGGKGKRDKKRGGTQQLKLA